MVENNRDENEDIACVLDEIADMLELLGESIFKVRAYRKSAAGIRELTGPLSHIYEEGGIEAIEEIPGIGKHIGERVEEYLQTGSMEYFNELKSKVPESLVEMMNIPGLASDLPPSIRSSNATRDTFGSRVKRTSAPPFISPCMMAMRKPI
jgi:DNA polymerase (family 10)